MKTLFTNLWMQLASVSVILIGTLINPIIGFLAFMIYFGLWAFNYTKNFQ